MNLSAECIVLDAIYYDDYFAVAYELLRCVSCRLNACRLIVRHYLVAIDYTCAARSCGFEVREVEVRAEAFGLLVRGVLIEVTACAEVVALDVIVSRGFIGV